MKSNRLLAITIFLGFSSLFSVPAFAECTVPNVIANGQVADASKVMDNFTAIAGCVDGGVRPTGTPQEGAIAVFSGTQTVTGGNLTGDVTTAGSTATALSNTGVAPGTYINPNITVDTKGRIVAATNGVGSGGGGWTELTLVNPGAEAGSGTGWTMSGGGFTVTGANPAGHTFTPITGSYAFVATANAGPTMTQVTNMSTFAMDIDTGNVSVMLEAYAADTYTTGENPYVYINFLNAAGNRIALAITNPPARSLGAGSWRFMSISGRLPPLTRSISFTLSANRADGTQNNVAFDEVRAFMRID